MSRNVQGLAPAAIVRQRETEVLQALAEGGATPQTIVYRVGFTRSPARILRLLCDLADQGLVYFAPDRLWRLTGAGKRRLHETRAA